MPPKDYKPISFKQLCAIVKTVILEAPSMNDAEWKARTKDKLAKWGFQEPPADMLVRAMNAVEYNLQRTMGPRPADFVEAREPPPLTPYRKESRTSNPAGWDIVTALLDDLASRGSLRSPEKVTHEAEPMTPFVARMRELLAELEASTSPAERSRIEYEMAKTFRERFGTSGVTLKERFVPDTKLAAAGKDE